MEDLPDIAPVLHLHNSCLPIALDETCAENNTSSYNQRNNVQRELLTALYGGLSDDSVDDADNGNDSVPDMYVGKQILAKRASRMYANSTSQPTGHHSNETTIHTLANSVTGEVPEQTDIQSDMPECSTQLTHSQATKSLKKAVKKEVSTSMDTIESQQCIHPSSKENNSCSLSYNLCLTPDSFEMALKLSMKTCREEENNNATTTQRLRQNCETYGLRFRAATPADGSCFFHAIADQLEYRKLSLHYKSAEELRNMVVDRLLKNYMFEAPNGLVDLRNYVPQQWNEYCQSMRLPSTYADNVVVLVLARLLKRDILVVTSSEQGGSENCLTWILGSKSSEGCPLTIGHIWENHYQSLMPKFPKMFIDLASISPDLAGISCNTSDHISKGTENISESNFLLSEVSAEDRVAIELKISDTLMDIDDKGPTGNIGEEPCISVFDKIVHETGNEIVSMEDQLMIKMVKRDLRLGKDVIQTFKVLRNENAEDFVFSTLEEAFIAGEGSFSHHKAKDNQRSTVCPGNAFEKEALFTTKSHYYYCERHSQPRSFNKECDPCKTTANACNAFIAFLFHHIHNHGVIVVEIRRRSKHNGHDPNNPSEWRKNPIDPHLVEYMECLVEKKRFRWEILILAVGWAKGRGKHNFNDRRYFPVPHDIDNVIKRTQRRERYDGDDVVSVDHLCNVVLKDSIVLYEGGDINSEKPLVIVYMNRQQLKRMGENNMNIAFMDATYKGITQYGYALYCVHGIAVRGGGVPFAYFIISKENTEILSKCLQAIVVHARKHGIVFSPRTFMVDRDKKEQKAIENVFPGTDVLLCWFHVLQAVCRELSSKGSGLSGNQHTADRKAIINYLRKMKYAIDKDEFDSLAEQFPTVFKDYPVAVKYITERWIPDGTMWANWGRKKCHEDQETNNIAERFFLRLKYTFLGGMANRRLDDLLILLDGNVAMYYDIMEELYKAGRLVSKRDKEPHGVKAAKVLILQGWLEQCRWMDDRIGQCIVPSQSEEGRYWTVNLTSLTCDCPSSAMRGMCKHVHLAFAKGGDTFNVDVQRELIADELIASGNYEVHADDVVSVYHNDFSSVIGAKACTCVASSHGHRCICVMVAEKVTVNSTTREDGCDSDMVLLVESADGDGDGTQAGGELEKVGNMLSELTTLFQSGRLEEHPQRKEILKHIKCAHLKATKRRFGKVTSDLRIKPNSQSRSIIEKAKRQRQMMVSNSKPSQAKKGQKFCKSVRRPPRKNPLKDM